MRIARCPGKEAASFDAGRDADFRLAACARARHRDDKRQDKRLKYGLPTSTHAALPPISETPLVPHPSCQALPDLRLAATARIEADGSLRLHYRIAGAVRDVRWPQNVAAEGLAQPTDGLWQHTCGEAFVAEADGSAYREFNFSPSGEWANYRFSAYRDRDAAFVPPAAPAIEFACQAADCSLQVRIPPCSLPAGRQLAIGLSAVIETLAGARTYWALAHTAPQPDFHPHASFTLLLDTAPT